MLPDESRAVKQCTTCKQTKPLREFYKHKRNKDGHRVQCKECEKKSRRNNSRHHKIVDMAKGARRRAKKSGIPYTITKEDVLEVAEGVDFCPFLGIPLDWNYSDDGNGKTSYFSPSLDRIDNSKGYEKGNIRVVSWLFNTTKRDVDINSDSAVDRFRQFLLLASAQISHDNIFHGWSLLSVHETLFNDWALPVLQ